MIIFPSQEHVQSYSPLRSFISANSPPIRTRLNDADFFQYIKHPGSARTKWIGKGVAVLSGRSINGGYTLVAWEWKTFREFISEMTSHLYFLISYRPIWRSLLCVDWKGLIATTMWMETHSTPMTVTVMRNRLNHNRCKQVVRKVLIQSSGNMKECKWSG